MSTLNFSNVTDVVIPNAEVVKITRTSDNAMLWCKIFYYIDDSNSYFVDPPNIGHGNRHWYSDKYTLKVPGIGKMTFTYATGGRGDDGEGIGLFFYDSSGNCVGSSAWNWASWTTYTQTVNIPTTATKVEIQLWCYYWCQCTMKLLKQVL